jgi:hypothetical protein
VGDTAQSWAGLALMVEMRLSVVLLLPTTKSTLYCNTQSPQTYSKTDSAEAPNQAQNNTLAVQRHPVKHKAKSTPELKQRYMP